MRLFYVLKECLSVFVSVLLTHLLDIFIPNNLNYHNPQTINQFHLSNITICLSYISIFLVKPIYVVLYIILLSIKHENMDNNIDNTDANKQRPH